MTREEFWQRVYIQAMENGPRYCGAREYADQALEAFDNLFGGGDQGDDGWIEWHGGDEPPTDEAVVVRFRDGETAALAYPQGARWTHYGPSGDIIAYRIADKEQGQ